MKILSRWAQLDHDLIGSLSPPFSALWSEEMMVSLFSSDTICFPLDLPDFLTGNIKAYLNETDSPLLWIFVPFPIPSSKVAIDPRWCKPTSEDTGWLSSPYELYATLSEPEQPHSHTPCPWRYTEQDTPDSAMTFHSDEISSISWRCNFIHARCRQN